MERIEPEGEARVMDEKSERELEQLMKAPGAESSSGYRPVPEQKQQKRRRKRKMEDAELKRVKPTAERYREYIVDWLEDKDEFDAGVLLDDVSEHFYNYYMEEAQITIGEWLGADLRVLIRMFASQILYQTMHNLRPSQDYVGPLDPQEFEPDWFESAAGKYMRVKKMPYEAISESIRNREAQIRGHQWVVSKLREYQEVLPTPAGVLLSEVEPVVRSEEYKRFCWYCGTVLVGDEVEIGGEGGIDEGGVPRCTTCGTLWDRAYATDCPNHCNGFNHLFEPHTLGPLPHEGHIEIAQGPCWCDSCGDTFAYEWRMIGVGGETMLTISVGGLRGEHIIDRDPKDLIASSS
jgi:hypothetical protein